MAKKLEWRAVWNILHAVDQLGLDPKVAVADLERIGVGFIRARFLVDMTLKEGFSPRRFDW